MRRPSASLRRVTVTVRARAMAALLLLVVALALGGVQRAAAVPFAELSPKPTVQLVTSQNGYSFCVLMASGRGVSSVTAADLAPFADQKCDNPPWDPRAFNTVDLR